MTLSLTIVLFLGVVFGLGAFSRYYRLRKARPRRDAEKFAQEVITQHLRETRREE